MSCYHVFEALWRLESSRDLKFDFVGIGCTKAVILSLTCGLNLAAKEVRISRNFRLKSVFRLYLFAKAFSCFKTEHST